MGGEGIRSMERCEWWPAGQHSLQAFVENCADLSLVTSPSTFTCTAVQN